MLLCFAFLSLLPAITAEELLTRSIAHHDPEGRWNEAALLLTLGETRPDGSERRTALRIDNANGRFEMRRRLPDGRALEASVVGEEVSVTLDGSTAISESDAEAYRLTPEQVRRTRNYYLYLYGLPMKLRDPGTRLDPEPRETTFGERSAYELRVTYDEDVGSDTWYFYLDRDSFALIGYRFYHDETAGDGEYIVLREEASGAGLTLPRVREWRTHQGDEYLGTDTLLTISAP